jgi:hypothetical protein
MSALAWNAPVRNTPLGEPRITLGPVEVSFDEVTVAGNTAMSISAVGPTPPAGFQLGAPPTYYDLTTTATFGSAEVCINYTGISFVDEASLRLAHYEAPNWVDRTTSLDVDNNIICAEVTSFSPFAIFEPVSGDTTAPVLTVPSSIVKNADNPSGAAVTFAASATDDSGVVSITCLPASGSVFAIGTTPVSCTATDGSGNIDTDTFNVTVRGAEAQLVDLIERLRRMPLTAAARAQLMAALHDALASPRQTAIVCRTLRLFEIVLRVLSGRSIPAAMASELLSDSMRIRGVLGC